MRWHVSRIPGVLALTWMLTGLLPGQDFSCRPSSDQLRIAALSSKDWKGQAFLSAVERAFRQARKEGKAQNACLERHEYRGDAEGENSLVDLIKGGSVQVVLGPSDTGVFLGGLDRKQEWEGKLVPVVSSLVTASGGNEADGWFFRTNVEDQRRLWKIIDGLRPLWVTSLALLYADSGFGRSAEDMLRKDLENSMIHTYEAVPFGADLLTKRAAIKQVLNLRPEVVGIVGTIEDVIDLRRQALGLSEAVPYDPILFTIIDASRLYDKVDNLIFVSVTDRVLGPEATPSPQWEEKYEVATLAYDTAWLVLDLLGDTNRRAFQPTTFRDDLVNLLSRSSAKEGPLSGMKFKDMRNQAELKMLEIRQGQISAFSNDLSIWGSLVFKFKMLGRRFGPWGYVSLLTVAMGAFFITSLDVKKWFEGKYFHLLLRPQMWVLGVVNMSLAVGIFVALAERGIVAYDNFSWALGVGVGPSILLRTTFFQSPTGEALGAAKWYDEFMRWINRRLMSAKHRTRTSFVNVIAYLSRAE